MIFYPLSTLMLAGIKGYPYNYNKRGFKDFKSFLGNGEKYGVNISYAIQPKPEGIAQAFIIGEKFILILLLH